MTRRKYIKVDFGDVVEIYRKCKKCGEAHELSAGYHKSKACRCGHRPVCRSCGGPGRSREEYAAGKTYIRVDFEEVVRVYRRCTKCGEAHELPDGYHKSKAMRCGYRAVCKACVNPSGTDRSPEEACSEKTYIRVDFGDVVEVYRPCNKCGKAHELSVGYHKHKNKRSGYVSVCKACLNPSGIIQSHEEASAVKTYIKVDFEDVVQVYRTCKKCKSAYAISIGFNVDRVKRHGRRQVCKSCDSRAAVEWVQANPSGARYRVAKRKAAKLERTPFWVTEEHMEEIKAFYTESQKLKEDTGVAYHVDHIVPMVCGLIVSGLHVPWNLQVITATENLQKGNKFTLWDDD